MSVLRRIMVLLFVVTVLFSISICVSAFDLDEYLEYVPYGEYSFEILHEHGSSLYKSYAFFPLFDPEYVHLLIPVTIRIRDVYYNDSWKHAHDGSYYMGNLYLYDSRLADTGEPYFFGFTPEQRFACILRGAYPSSPGVLMHLYRGIPPEPSPPAVSDSIADSSIGDSLGYVLGWWSILWGSLIYGQLSSLLPVLALAVAIPLIFFVVKMIHKHL